MRQIIFICFCIVGTGQPGLATAPTSDNIEQCLHEAFYQSLAKGEDRLAPLLASLAANHGQSPTPDAPYWLGYGHYLHAKYFWANKESDKAGEAIDAAIEALEGIDGRDAEANALLGAMYSASIGTYPFKAVSLSGKAERCYKAAKKAAPDNLRVLYLMANSDYYKPKMYGGGKKVESYVLQAINLPEPQPAKAGAPTWGKADAYQLAVMYYQREDRPEEALLYCQRGLRQFPNHLWLRKTLPTLQ